MKSSAPLALPRPAGPAPARLRVASVWVCADSGSVGRDWGQVAPTALSLPPTRICSLHKVEATPFVPGCAFPEPCCHTHCRFWGYTCLWKAWPFLCPWTRLFGTCERTCHTRSINPTAWPPAHPAHSQKERKLRFKTRQRLPVRNVTHFALGWARLRNTCCSREVPYYSRKILRMT